MSPRHTCEPGLALSSCLYTGTVMHRRTAPAHRFRHRLFWMLIDLDELDRLDREFPLFAVNRGSVASFHERDHGPRDGTALRPWIDGQLVAAGLDPSGGRVRLMCLPRILGYAFNPLTLWFCYRRDGRLQAVLYEVSNTFGQHHCYLFTIDGDAPAPHGCAKEFHVSPFTEMTDRYSFQLVPPGPAMSLHIRQTGASGEVLVATMAGRRVALTPSSFAATLARHPLATFGVTGAILWQALRLWRKGARARTCPPAPANLVTIVPPAPTPVRVAA